MHGGLLRPAREIGGAGHIRRPRARPTAAAAGSGGLQLRGVAASGKRARARWRGRLWLPRAGAALLPTCSLAGAALLPPPYLAIRCFFGSHLLPSTHCRASPTRNPALSPSTPPPPPPRRPTRPPPGRLPCGAPRPVRLRRGGCCLAALFLLAPPPPSHRLGRELRPPALGTAASAAPLGPEPRALTLGTPSSALTAGSEPRPYRAAEPIHSRSPPGSSAPRHRSSLPPSSAGTRAVAQGGHSCWGLCYWSPPSRRTEVTPDSDITVRLSSSPSHPKLISTSLQEFMAVEVTGGSLPPGRHSIICTMLTPCIILELHMGKC